MSSAYCPHCDKNITSAMSLAHHESGENWYFECNCPECKKPLCVQIEIEEINYIVDAPSSYADKEE